METLNEILVLLFVTLGIGIAGTSLFNVIEDKELTKGRLITMIIFLPQTIVVGIFFATIAVAIWIHDNIRYSNHKFIDWWNSPIRKNDKEN